MKRIYVKPELQITTCFAEQFLAGSTKDVEWDTNTGGTDTKIDDTTEPDPEDNYCPHRSCAEPFRSAHIQDNRTV